MENTVFLGIILVIVFFAVRTVVKRAGRKGCCGSSSDYKPRKKKLKKVIATKVFVVDGMHCERCANRVTEVINDIPCAAGVTERRTDISPGNIVMIL